MASLKPYMTQHDHEHTNPWNKLFHGIGIPIIMAGIVLLALRHWGIGLLLFASGWILLFAGHRIEGNKPAFFQGVIYFLVGPIWAAKEINAYCALPLRSHARRARDRSSSQTN